jgi:hypothetical protein
MSATRIPPGWCPPTVAGQARYRWLISFEPTPDEWSPQCELIGAAPAGADLAAILTDWFRTRGGPAAWWRLQVFPMADPTTVTAQVKLRFTEPVQREVKRLGPKFVVAPTFAGTTNLQPPSPAQLRAWAKRDAGEDGAAPSLNR